MSKRNEYIQAAADCDHLSAISDNPINRILLHNMAAHWRLLAQAEINDNEGEPRARPPPA